MSASDADRLRLCVQMHDSLARMIDAVIDGDSWLLRVADEMVGLLGEFVAFLEDLQEEFDDPALAGVLDEARERILDWRGLAAQARELHATVRQAASTSIPRGLGAAPRERGFPEGT